MIRLIYKYDASRWGKLSKAWYKMDSDIILVKGNTKRGFEPYSEAMVSRIGKLFNLPVVEYFLMPAELFPEVEVFGISHVSVCKNFVPLRCSFIPAEVFITEKFRGEPHDWLEDCKLYERVLNLPTIMWFDAFVGQEDRHLNNFGVIRDIDGNDYQAPIFDNGNSLLSSVSDESVLKESVQYIHDKSKPFRSKHKDQVKLFDKPKFNIPSIKEVFAVIQPILRFLPHNRQRAIINYLTWRWKEYVIS